MENAILRESEGWCSNSGASRNISSHKMSVVVNLSVYLVMEIDVFHVSSVEC